MTPRERWEAAVRQQHDAVRAIESRPPDADTDAWRPVLDVVNAATETITDVAREVPRGTFTNEEWTAAYGLHRNALMASNRRRMSHEAQQLAKSAAEDARAFYQLARRHFE